MRAPVTFGDAGETATVLYHGTEVGHFFWCAETDAWLACLDDDVAKLVGPGPMTFRAPTSLEIIRALEARLAGAPA